MLLFITVCGIISIYRQIVLVHYYQLHQYFHSISEFMLYSHHMLYVTETFTYELTGQVPNLPRFVLFTAYVPFWRRDSGVCVCVCVCVCARARARVCARSWWWSYIRVETRRSEHRPKYTERCADGAISRNYVTSNRANSKAKQAQTFRTATLLHILPTGKNEQTVPICRTQTVGTVM